MCITDRGCAAIKLKLTNDEIMIDWEEDFDNQRLKFLKKMTPEKMLRELLATLHGDGGQHTDIVGLAQSVLDAEQRLETSSAVNTIVNGLMVKTEDGIGKVISQPYTDVLEIDVDGATGLYNIQDLKAL